MPNDDTFVAAICANPDDDAPRLVYADWLEEQGDNARAEFIRAQIELARTTEPSANREWLETRQKKLEQAFKKKWTEPLKGIADNCVFARGFVMTVTMPAERFDSVADRLFRLAPVRAVTFTNPVGMMYRVANCPYLSRLTVVEFLSSYSTAIEAVTSGNPFSERSWTIGVPDDRLGDIDLQALLSSPHLSIMRCLNLVGANITLDGLQLLLNSPVATNLMRLSLHGVRLGDEGARAIAECQHLQNLEWLNLSNTGIGRTVAELFGRLLNRLRGERATPIQPSPVQALAASAHFPKLRDLNLRGNRLFEADKRVLRARFGAHVHL